jgi:hypothetical protein
VSDTGQNLAHNLNPGGTTASNGLLTYTAPPAAPAPAAGKLGVDDAAESEFDVYARLRAGVAVENEAYAALVVGGSPVLYSIELTTGRVTREGVLGDRVVDIALPLDQKE